ncbi:unnamed protein product [Soboliphyme baturini]|uniref:Uncharacterized protein n=1 Tax=Soboliphyme baturini TaxID=241478 RepID=A0A183IDQ4_9BILA|nr:unnamed protein product [Soboliphyme baturini]
MVEANRFVYSFQVHVWESTPGLLCDDLLPNQPIDRQDEHLCSALTLIKKSRDTTDLTSHCSRLTNGNNEDD